MTHFQIFISIFTMLVSAGVFAGLYQIGKKIGSFEKTVATLEKTLEKLPCSEREKEIQDNHDDELPS